MTAPVYPSLESCDEDGDPPSLAHALERAFLAGDLAALRRIAQRAEAQIAHLQASRRNPTTE